MTQQIVFQREIVIDAPLDHVWQLVATEHGLHQWWGNKISLEAKEGGRCEEWRVKPGQTEHWQGVVTLYAPPHQLMLTLRAQDAPVDFPELTTITISLETSGTQTRVHIAQRAIAASPAIGTPLPRESKRQPASLPSPYGTPLAQLARTAPGTLPMPTPHATVGRVEPVQNLLSRQQADAVAATWQTRVDALIQRAMHQTNPQ